MKKLSSGFIYQLMSLIVAILLVHAIYVAVIRPNANSLLETQAELINADPTYVPERSAYIIVKDLEQEACFILMLWAMALMGIKARDNHRERALFEIDLLPRNQSNSILPEDTRDYARPIEALSADAQQRLLPRTLLTALHRFRATGNIQDVAHTIRGTCESEGERLGIGAVNDPLHRLGDSLDWLFWAPFAALGKPLVKRIKPHKATLPVLPKALALPSTQPSLPF